jgi:hypothetical protein
LNCLENFHLFGGKQKTGKCGPDRWRNLDITVKLDTITAVMIGAFTPKIRNHNLVGQIREFHAAEPILDPVIVPLAACEYAGGDRNSSSAQDRVGVHGKVRTLSSLDCAGEISIANRPPCRDTSSGHLSSLLCEYASRRWCRNFFSYLRHLAQQQDDQLRSVDLSPVNASANPVVSRKIMQQHTSVSAGT